MSTAILFNGAAAYIGQEVGILDLLLNDSDVQRPANVPLINIDDVQFVGGLSSGALMSFSFNVAFCNPPKISWDVFKETRLFNLTTDKIYTGQKPFDTSPLRKFLEDITKEVGYNFITDLPIDTAILVSYRNIVYPGKDKSYWLTNIANLASELPTETDTSKINTNVITKNIKEHQNKLELVSSLMCSTAIPLTFPAQKLNYKDKNNRSQPIKKNAIEAAKFVDGGSGIDDIVFSGFQEFFDAYLKHNERFDKIYFISPNFAKTEAEALQRISLAKGKDADEEEPDIDPLLIMDTWTNSFIKAIKEYNSESILADTIYYCKPDVEGFNALDFSSEQTQYEATIAWGQSNSDKIAIDINSISYL